MSDESKAKILFDKGSEAFNNKNYEDALRYFNESLKFHNKIETEEFLDQCRKEILKKSSADNDCNRITNLKDYYEILGIPKTASEEDIKKAYRKLAILYHPDKNPSQHAGDAFKKISHAFTTLKDPEKKAFYDKYGSEEELREKYAQQQQAHAYTEEDIDPFDLFEKMFFGMGNNVNFNRNRRQQQQQYRHENVENHRRVNRNMIFIQLLPFLIIILYSIIPYIFNTKPYYQFNRDEDYYKKMMTSYNNVVYYVGDSFIKKYTNSEDVKNLELSIEKEYISYLGQQCSNVVRYKNDLEMKLAYYRNHPYRGMIENELRNLDLNICQKYYEMRNRVH